MFFISHFRTRKTEAFEFTLETVIELRLGLSSDLYVILLSFRILYLVSPVIILMR